MTSFSPLGDACYASLVQCLQRLSDNCPDPVAATSPVHRLRNLVLVLRSQASFPDPAPAPGLTLGQALTLVSTSQGLLAALAECDTSGFMGTEMSQALSDTLRDLLDQLGPTAAGHNRQAGCGACTLLSTPR